MLDKRKFYINGQWVDPVKKNDFEVINPCNEDPFAIISLGSKEDTDLAVKSAKNAFETWKETSKEERLSLLEKLSSIYKKIVKVVRYYISVKYRITHTNGKIEEIDNPCELPSAGEISSIEEPWLSTTLISPSEYTGTLMELCQGRRGELDKLSYLSPERIELKYRLPLAEVVLNFFDQLKSRTQGYASLDYEPAGYMESDLVRVDILLQGEPVDAFSAVVHRDASYEYGRKMAERLKDLIPRQQFEVPIQATIGGRIIARETVKAFRKDVTAKLYGGDITRKRKLLEKQKQGKRKMKSIGRVEVPQEAFVSALSLEE